jgi:hypothetical protein
MRPLNSFTGKPFKSTERATARSLRPPTTSPVPIVCTQNGFCPGVATMTLAAKIPIAAEGAGDRVEHWATGFGLSCESRMQRIDLDHARRR